MLHEPIADILVIFIFSLFQADYGTLCTKVRNEIHKVTEELNAKLDLACVSLIEKHKEAKTQLTQKFLKIIPPYDKIDEMIKIASDDINGETESESFLRDLQMLAWKQEIMEQFKTEVIFDFMIMIISKISIEKTGSFFSEFCDIFSNRAYFSRTLLTDSKLMI